MRLVLSWKKHGSEARQCAVVCVVMASPNPVCTFHLSSMRYGRWGAEYDAEGTYGRHIDAAAAGAAAALLGQVTRGGALDAALGALKAYLLLARGDTLTTFLDTADGELGRPAAEVSTSRLQSLLELGAAA